MLKTNIFSLPREVIEYVVQYLDTYTAFNLFTTCKYFYLYNKKLCDKYRTDLISFHNKQLQLRHKLHNIILRNIFVESFNLYGECEDCGCLGFLRQVDLLNYHELHTLPTKCICIESCKINTFNLAYVMTQYS